MQVIIVAFIYLLVPLAFCAGILTGYLIGLVLWWYELRMRAWRLKKLERLNSSWKDLGDGIQFAVHRLRNLQTKTEIQIEALCSNKIRQA